MVWEVAPVARAACPLAAFVGLAAMEGPLGQDVVKAANDVLRLAGDAFAYGKGGSVRMKCQKKCSGLFLRILF